MSKPGAVKTKIAKKLGKAIPPGSSFAQVDWDKAQEVLSGTHNPDDYILGKATDIFQKAKEEYLKAGRESKANKIQADINSFDNARQAIRSSWCPTCLNFLHNCQCQVEVDIVSTEFIDSITSQLAPTHSQLRKAKRLAREAS